MPSSVVLPEAQELALTALVESGAYKTQSEIMRSALDDFLHHAPKATMLTAAVWAYKKGKASLSQTARMANVEHEEMHRILVREGIFRTGATAKNIEAESDFLVGQAKGKQAKA